MNSGSTSLPSGGAVQDWAFVPGAGSYLYAVAVDTSGATTLNAWSTATKTWTTLGSLGTTVAQGSVTGGNAPRFNALYAGAAQGILYGSEGYSGQIWRFNVLTRAATFVTSGPSSDLADGARCYTNTGA